MAETCQSCQRGLPEAELPKQTADVRRLASVQEALTETIFGILVAQAGKGGRRRTTIK